MGYRAVQMNLDGTETMTEIGQADHLTTALAMISALVTFAAAVRIGGFRFRVIRELDFAILHDITI